MWYRFDERYLLVAVLRIQRRYLSTDQTIQTLMRQLCEIVDSPTLQLVTYKNSVVTGSAPLFSIRTIPYKCATCTIHPQRSYYVPFKCFSQTCVVTLKYSQFLLSCSFPCPVVYGLTNSDNLQKNNKQNKKQSDSKVKFRGEIFRQF